MLYRQRTQRAWARAIATCLGLLLPATIAVADGAISGWCGFPRIVGRPQRWTDLHEWNLYLIPSGSMFTDAMAYRVDHGYYALPYPVDDPEGKYSPAPGGIYSIYINQPEFFTRAKVINNVELIENDPQNVNPDLDNLDYSCYYKSDWPGGWDSTWYQTFIATGTSINKIAYVFAGADADMSGVAVTLLQDTGGNVTTWQQVEDPKTGGVSRQSGEAWVGYRSGDLPTTPGQRYAVRLVGQGSQRNFSPYWRTDSGDGYADGQAYDKYGNPLNKDLNILVFSDNDGTVIPYMKTTGGLGGSTWWEWQWGQTFKATGDSLAAVDLWFAHGGGLNWYMQMTFTVYANPPNPPNPPSGQVGVTKRGRGAWQAGGTALMGICYAPDEVPLVAGQTYYIEMTPYWPPGDPDPPLGYEASRFDRPEDAYPYGHAYANRNPQPDIDLSMTIMEYAQTGPPPEIERSPASFTRSVERGENLDDGNTFTVANIGGGTMSYSVTDDAGWFSVDPSGGVSSGEADPISIIYDVASLPIGSYIGTITINAPGATNTPQYVMVYLTVEPPEYAPCDFDQDHDVDQEDFGKFQSCYSGPGIAQNDASCSGARLDDDDDVDLSDFALFQGCISGPNQPADPLCAD